MSQWTWAQPGIRGTFLYKKFEEVMETATPGVDRWRAVIKFWEENPSSPSEVQEITKAYLEYVDRRDRDPHKSRA